MKGGKVGAEVRDSMVPELVSSLRRGGQSTDDLECDPRSAP